MATSTLNLQKPGARESKPARNSVTGEPLELDRMFHYEDYPSVVNPEPSIQTQPTLPSAEVVLAEAERNISNQQRQYIGSMPFKAEPTIADNFGVVQTTTSEISQPIVQQAHDILRNGQDFMAPTSEPQKSLTSEFGSVLETPGEVAQELFKASEQIVKYGTEVGKVTGEGVFGVYDALFTTNQTIGAENRNKPDPKKAAESQKILARRHQMDTAEISIEDGKRAIKAALEADSVRILEDVGGVGLSEDEAARILNESRGYKGKMTIKRAFDLREALKAQQAAQKKAQTSFKTPQGKTTGPGVSRHDTMGENAQHTYKAVG